ncbi:MAG: AIPR family protein, partial [Phycisphaerales bacterium]|nr:AIPR family protein [Phycisphaerales bacterium]
VPSNSAASTPQKPSPPPCERTSSPETSHRYPAPPLQTADELRDIKANDVIQKNLQRAFLEKFSLLYERKPNEFAHNSRDEQKKVISNERIGQAYLAIVLKRPSDGRRRKYKIWGDDYHHVFTSSAHPEAYLLSYRVYDACTKIKRSIYDQFEGDDLKRFILANGVFHACRCIAFLWRNGDDWNQVDALQRQLRELDEHGYEDTLRPHFDDSLDRLVDVIKEDREFTTDPSNALKSPRLDEEITRDLYSHPTLR